VKTNITIARAEIRKEVAMVFIIDLSSYDSLSQLVAYLNLVPDFLPQFSICPLIYPWEHIVPKATFHVCF